MKNVVARAIVAIIICAIAASCGGQAAPQTTDNEYIRIADGAAEAQAFLRQYPEAEILVDRSSKLAVDYLFTQFQPTSTEQSWQGIRLRIFIDPRDNRVDDSFIQCSDQNGSTIVEEELIAFIEKYGETKTCR